MKTENFEWLARTLAEETGLVLGEANFYVLSARLSPFIEKAGVNDVDGLVELIRKTPRRDLLDHVLHAMTTRKPWFFGDPPVFETLFKFVVPRLVAQRGATRSLRVWSAACAAGQEPFSILMGLYERLPILRDWNIELFATDLNDQLLERARSAMFNHFDVQRGLPAAYLIKYFTRADRGYRLIPEIASRVQFRKLNIAHSLDPLPAFDVIFCRNVLVHFAPGAQKDILERLLGTLATDGYLLLGSGENATGLSRRVQTIATPDGPVYANSPADQPA